MRKLRPQTERDICLRTHGLCQTWAFHSGQALIGALTLDRATFSFQSRGSVEGQNIGGFSLPFLEFWAPSMGLGPCKGTWITRLGSWTISAACVRGQEQEGGKDERKREKRFLVQ